MIGSYIGTPIGGVIATGLSNIFGELNATEADDTIVSSGALDLSGQLSASETGDAVSATGVSELHGTANLTENDDALSSSGKVEIEGREDGHEADDALSAVAGITVRAGLGENEADDSVSSTALSEYSGQVNLTEGDDTLFADATLRLPQTGAWAPSKVGKKKRTKKEEERLLEQALAKAFESKRGPKRHVPEPWLAESVIVPEPLELPEFNPRLAGLSDYVADLQTQLAQRKFDLSQMEADDELLLLSL